MYAALERGVLKKERTSRVRPRTANLGDQFS